MKPREEATLAYAFFVSESYSTRPYGLTVNVYYKDAVSDDILVKISVKADDIFEFVGRQTVRQRRFQ